MEQLRFITDKHTKRTFELRKLLGDGTTAKVYEAKETKTEKTFACKIIPYKFKDAALQEIETLKDLKYEHIIQIESWFRDHDNIYLLMEICIHQSLIDIIEQRSYISEDEARCIVRQLNNIFLEETMEIKIGDFGLAAYEHDNVIDVVGTPNYLAPEDTCQRIKNCDYKIPNHVGKNARDLIKCILRKNPTERPTAAEILEMPFFRQGVQLKRLPTHCLRAPPNLYEVQKIIDSRKDAKGRLEYLIYLANHVLLPYTHPVTSSTIFSLPIATFSAQEIRQSPIETTIASTMATIVAEDGPDGAACTAAHCNERGTCFGTKAMPLCLCQLGFAGVNCKDTYCDSTRDCSGRGWCMGTSSQFSCLCNLGFTGERCDKETPILVPTVQPPPTPRPIEGSMEAATGFREHTKMPTLSDIVQTTMRD
uniref:Uncharacterized protein n=1 Tax=Ditylenchus dipsaci TaxID=166011 RepID=A0A915EG13_9BILA